MFIQSIQIDGSMVTGIHHNNAAAQNRSWEGVRSTESTQNSYTWHNGENNISWLLKAGHSFKLTLD